MGFAGGSDLGHEVPMDLLGPQDLGGGQIIACPKTMPHATSLEQGMG
jgi:hypothetical protein